MNELNKLRWRCRRGTLELDRMLIRHLEDAYVGARQSEQHAFLQLLELEDSELIRYLMGDALPDSADLAELVAKIRGVDSRPEDDIKRATLFDEHQQAPFDLIQSS